MTEEEWMACTDPIAMLDFLRGKASDRTLRLFAVACCRRVWRLFRDPRSQYAVETAERFADGCVSDEERQLARRAAAAVIAELWEQAGVLTSKEFDYATVPEHTAATILVDDANLAARQSLYIASDMWMFPSPDSEALAEGEGSAELTFVRDIFGKPFRPITLDPAWLTWHDGLLMSMARQMYDSRDFSDMPILADALEEARCPDQDILAHCRSGAEHVRGCWVLDAIMNRT
jgi:hypothetical protein